MDAAEPGLLDAIYECGLKKGNGKPVYSRRKCRMSTLTIVLLIILAVLIAGLIFLYFWGKKLQKKQDESQAQMEAAKQVVQIFVIDKKMLPLKESGLPQIVIDQTPKLMRRSKMPIVKARVQGRIMTLVADQKIFPLIPTGKSVKATLSGIYIMDVKAIRGKLETPPPKKKWYQKLKPGKKEATDSKQK